jgi:hypothetical protein
MSEKLCNTEFTPSGVTLQFTNGTTLVCDVNELSPELMLKAALFGIRRKVTNSFAEAKGNVSEAQASATAAWEQLKAGMWTAPRETSGEGKAVSDLVEAIMAVTGKPREAVEEKLDALSKEARSALRKNDQVKAELDEIRARRSREKAAKSGPVDVGSMFQ